MYFHAPSLVTFYFYELTHFLDGMKNTLLFVTNILVHLLTVNMKNCLNPPKSENVRPHYSQSSRENVTPSSRTSLLACYKEVPPSPGHDSRPKRAKSVPVFKLKRRKNPIVGAAHTFMTYIREYPHHHPPPPLPVTPEADYPYFLSTVMQTTIHPLTLDNNIIFQDVFVEFQQA